MLGCSRQNRAGIEAADPAFLPFSTPFFFSSPRKLVPGTHAKYLYLTETGAQDRKSDWAQAIEKDSIATPFQRPVRPHQACKRLPEPNEDRVSMRNTQWVERIMLMMTQLLKPQISILDRHLQIGGDTIFKFDSQIRVIIGLLVE
eukprot:gene16177-biopygen4532